MTMHTAIARSCNTYFYTVGREVGINKIAEAARALGFGAEHELPLPSQRYGTIPDEAWKLKRYKQEWTQSDTLNASIGQGYVLVSPFQLALSAARIASGRMIEPSLIFGKAKQYPPLPFPEEHIAIVRAGMDEVVNGHGTAGASKLQIEGVRMGGKTGTAQVRRIMDKNRGQGGEWKYRDHGLFICFAPVDNPRYAASVVIEHGLGGAKAGAPVAKDVLTFLYDRDKAMQRLVELEAGWGGDIATRMAAKAKAFQAEQSTPPPPAPEDTEAAASNVAEAAAAATTNTVDTDAANTTIAEPDE